MHSTVSPEIETFHVNPAVRLHWRSWSDEYVIFDDASGQTHQMDPVRAFVLNSLAEQALPFTTLLQDLTAFPMLAEAPELKGTLGDILNELNALGLVEATTR